MSLCRCIIIKRTLRGLFRETDFERTTIEGRHQNLIGEGHRSLLHAGDNGHLQHHYSMLYATKIFSMTKHRVRTGTLTEPSQCDSPAQTHLTRKVRVKNRKRSRSSSKGANSSKLRFGETVSPNHRFRTCGETMVHKPMF